MAPLSLVTVHHEGAGDPSDIARGAHGGYTYWLGATGWTRLRSPYESYATLGFNHVSVDCCLSGDRDNWDVTDADLAHFQQIGADARSRGELVTQPMVRPHRWSPGSSTVCPGQKSMARWNQIQAAFLSMSPSPVARTHPTLVAGTWGPAVSQLQHELDVGTGAHLAVDGIFGPATRQTVFGFQAFFHLAVDGIVGPQTWGMADFCYQLKGGR